MNNNNTVEWITLKNKDVKNNTYPDAPNKCGEILRNGLKCSFCPKFYCPEKNLWRCGKHKLNLIKSSVIQNSTLYSNEPNFTLSKPVDPKIIVLNIKHVFEQSDISKIIKIQAWFRGCLVRRKLLPLILYQIKRFLQNNPIHFCIDNNDGRTNSCIDEDVVIKSLQIKFKNIIKIPKIRMWYDILIKDRLYGWILVNIKSTSTTTCDNIGNLATCVYAYTNENLDLHSEQTFENGKMSRIIIDNLINKKYNLQQKKDYYFIVLNKMDNQEIIINSIKGLTHMTANLNNLPFQVCWKKNKIYNFTTINEKVKLFYDCITKPKPSWREIFIQDIRALKDLNYK